MATLSPESPLESKVHALRVEHLMLRSFRNLAAVELVAGAQFNVLHGENGAGKSNLLEAIYYVAALESFRGAKTDDLIANGASASMLEAKMTGKALSHEHRVTLYRERARQVLVNGKRARSIAAWHASMQMVLFHPGHLELVTGSPELRRLFLNRIVEQMDPTFRPMLRTYERALRSRNRLLRERADTRSITAYDELLASAGAVVGKTRARLVDDIAPVAEAAFRDVVGEELPLRVAYRSRVEPAIDALRAALHRSVEKDLARGFTAEGPHADDLVLSMREPGKAARHHASQGQHRAIVLALKIAELEVLTRRVGRVPVFLLDDVSSELDRTRTRRLFDVLSGLGGQVFLTTTHPEFILLDRDRTDFHVHAGRVAR